MKIGICTSAENAVLLKGIADYVELNLTQLASMTDGEFEKVKELLDGNGVSAETTNCLFPGDIKLCGSEMNIDVIKAYTEKALERASKLGVHTSVLGSGNSRRVPDDIDFADGIKQLDEVFYTVGECAAKYGITVVIEPLNKHETNYVNSVAEGAETVKRVNHPNIKLLADIYHMAVENDDINSIAENGEILRHVHIANPEGRTFPLTEEEYDYGAVKKALKAAGYDLRISIEGGFKGDLVETATKSIELLKKIFN